MLLTLVERKFLSPSTIKNEKNKKQFLVSVSGLSQHNNIFTLLKKPTHALASKTLFYIHIKNTKNLLKKCSVKGVIIKPYMFQPLFHDHPQGSSFVLSTPTTYQPPALLYVFFGFVAVCHLFVCVSGVAVCVLSGRALHDQTTHRQLH
jgi:hypothetical protein